ncbi:MAG TPA: EAL domain-containing protein [Planctomycetota bacterium]|nr:EAL domain-containing protein [Planctomycetota bacterium]
MSRPDPKPREVAPDPDCLPERDSVSLLLRETLLVPPQMVCNEAYEIFSKDPSLHSLPVVDGTRPMGMINRHLLVEQYSKLFFRELYGRHPISTIMEKAPLIVDQGMSLDDLSRILVEDGEKFLYDGFIITRRGHYAGMGRAHDLMAELTRRKQAHLFHIAHHDMLTGLPNRQLFQDRLRQAVSKAARDRSHLAVLFIDLDHFKTVNDTLGHGAGDQILCTMARRLERCVRASDTVARLGGDEFTVILAELSRAADAAVVADKILRTLAEPVELKGRPVRVSGSIGISQFPEDGDDWETLVQQSDSALYHAKESRNRFQFFQQRQHAQVMHRHALQEDLRQAYEKGQFLLHFQPQVDLSSGRVAGVEALLRWRHPERGLVTAAEFIESTEETGLIIPLGDWVLAEACRQAVVWRQRGLTLWTAVNVSGRQFQAPGFASRILRCLREHGLPPSVLQLELTESIALETSEEALRDLEDLRREGVQLAMDDFGSGYSSLSYLRRFTFDILKIDRTFVKDIPDRARDCAIARAILSMAHSLDLKVVAEGVETREQQDLLRESGCDLMQGYLFSPAVPAEEVEALLARGRTRGQETAATG